MRLFLPPQSVMLDARGDSWLCPLYFAYVTLNEDWARKNNWWELRDVRTRWLQRRIDQSRRFRDYYRQRWFSALVIRDVPPPWLFDSEIPGVTREASSSDIRTVDDWWLRDCIRCQIIPPKPRALLQRCLWKRQYD
jgi:hypothetical protein